MGEAALKRVHIVGRKNSGKTTLIVELVTCLTKRGYRVGTIKHTHHQHELDTPGKDSHRHREAGARAVGIFTPDMSAVFCPRGPDQDGDARYALLDAAFAECDIVLVEGHLKTSGDKIEVWRAQTGADPLAQSETTVLAVVTDDPVEVSSPVWPRANVDDIADRILVIL